MSARRYEFADMLREMTNNAGCEGVSPDLRFAVHNLSAHERGKLAALLGVYGFVTISDVTAATGLTPEQVTTIQAGEAVGR